MIQYFKIILPSIGIVATILGFVYFYKLKPDAPTSTSAAIAPITVGQWKLDPKSTIDTISKTALLTGKDDSTNAYMITNTFSGAKMLDKLNAGKGSIVWLDTAKNVKHLFIFIPENERLKTGKFYDIDNDTTPFRPLYDSAQLVPFGSISSYTASGFIFYDTLEQKMRISKASLKLILTSGSEHEFLFAYPKHEEGVDTDHTAKPETGLTAIPQREEAGKPKTHVNATQPKRTGH